MIDTPTRFILGAGASFPYGYPTGAELRAQIVASPTKRWDEKRAGTFGDGGGARLVFHIVVDSVLRSLGGLGASG